MFIFSKFSKGKFGSNVRTCPVVRFAFCERCSLVSLEGYGLSIFSSNHLCNISLDLLGSVVFFLSRVGQILSGGMNLKFENNLSNY